MTNEQILKKAIEKAVKGGYIFDYTKRHWSKSFWHKLQFQGNYERYIFSHDFAKAFWGEGKEYWLMEMTSGGYEQDDFSLEWIHADKACTMKEWEERCRDEQPDWQYHLSKLVLEKNPIKYLEKFL